MANLGYRRSRTLKVLLVLAALVTCGFGSGTAVSWLQFVPLAEQPVVAYGGERGELLEALRAEDTRRRLKEAEALIGRALPEANLEMEKK